MSYPYGRPGDASGGQGGVGPGDPMFGGGPYGRPGDASGGPGGRPVSAPGSGGRKSSAGVIVACLVGLVVAALVVGVAFVVVRLRGVEPGSNTTATARPTSRPTITSDHYWADVLGGEFHIESTSVVQGPTDQDGAATLLVTLTMTNNTNESEFIMNYVPFLEQHGVDLDFAKLDHDQYPDVVVEMNDDKIEPGETRTLVVGFKYIYVGESVVFQTDVPGDENPLEYPHIIVQPS